MTEINSIKMELNQPMFKIHDFKILDTTQTITQKDPFLVLIAGDASDRKFFRLLNNSSEAICMQFPRWEGNYGGDPISWIGMHNALSQLELPLPKILEIDETNSCIWTEDLGDTFLNSTFYEPILDIDNQNCQKSLNFYKESLSLLIKAQYPNKIVDHPAINRLFDFDKLFFELNFFVTHFLNGFLKLNINENNEKHNGLFQDLKFLSKKLNDCEKVLCHRDYHVRNIMIKNEKIYWIDFQDARMGPHSYDVVSLVRDSYVKINWKTRKYLFNYYLDALNIARKEKKLSIISEPNFRLEVLLMGLQRNIKAIGSFGYLATIKNKPNYLQYVKPTLQILSSPEAQIHEDLDLKCMMPHLYELIDDLYQGNLSFQLDQKIKNNF